MRVFILLAVALVVKFPLVFRSHAEEKKLVAAAFAHSPSLGEPSYNLQLSAFHPRYPMPKSVKKERLDRRIAKASEAEGRFPGLLEAAPDAMVVVDQTGRIVLVNSQTERLFGYQREELLGHDVEVATPGASPRAASFPSNEFPCRAAYPAYGNEDGTSGCAQRRNRVPGRGQP
jgi:PAS domain-containing protein